MQHSLGPNPDPARMLHTSVGKSDTAEAGAHSRMHHWKFNFTFPPPRVKDYEEAAIYQYHI